MQQHCQVWSKLWYPPNFRSKKYFEDEIDSLFYEVTRINQKGAISIRSVERMYYQFEEICHEIIYILNDECVLNLLEYYRPSRRNLQIFEIEFSVRYHDWGFPKFDELQQIKNHLFNLSERRFYVMSKLFKAENNYFSKKRTNAKILEALDKIKKTKYVA